MLPSMPEGPRPIFQQNGKPIDFPPPRDKYELQALVRLFFGYIIPDKAVCEGHTAPLDAIWHAYAATYPIMVWKASRGLGGKSTLLGTLGAIEMLTGMKVVVLGGSSQQSRRVHEVTDDIWKYRLTLPNGTEIEAPLSHLLADNPNLMETKAKNGAWMRAITASTKSARGPHPQRLNLDEVDEMDLTVFDAAMGQTMEAGSGFRPGTVISSTHQYPDKTMSVVLERARERGWPVLQWCLGADSLVLTEQGERRIVDVSPGDMVMTRAGWRPAQHVTYMGQKQTVELHLSNGRTLVCTPDHQIATSHGWLPAGSLVPLSDARSAVPTTIRAGIGVDRIVGMSARASRLQVPTVVMPMCSGGQAFEMVGVSAKSVSTEVVDLEPRWNGADQSAVGQTVGSSPVGLAVSRAIRSSLPHPAAVFVNYRSLSEVVGIDIDLLQGTVPPIGTHLADLSRRSPDFVPATASLHVVSITNGATVPVYDIGVEGEHEFVAEGVVVHNCYKENLESNGGWLLESEVERKKSEVTARMFNVEYDLQEPSVEGRAIDTDAVEVMFQRDLGVFEGKSGEYIEIQEPQTHAKYITGVDWARINDWTVICTFRVDGGMWKLVAFERVNRIPWPTIVEKVNKRIDRFGGQLAHDLTGSGDVVNDYLRHKARGILLVGRARAELFADYIIAIENGEIEAPRIDWMYREYMYATVDDLYGQGSTSHPPDSFVAGALAWSMRAKLITIPAPQFSDLTKVSLWT